MFDFDTVSWVTAWMFVLYDAFGRNRIRPKLQRLLDRLRPKGALQPVPVKVHS